MTTWNALLKSLDAAFGFPTRISSTVKKLRQGFDNTKQEHVIWIEYRVKVNPGSPSAAKAGVVQIQTTGKPARNTTAASQMPFLRELLTVDDL